MYFLRPNTKGFTLIELLVVIAIIGVLASIVLVSLNAARSRGNDSRRLADIQEIQKVLELYHLDHNAYPTAGWNCSFHSNWQTAGVGAALDPYMSELPVDPVNQNSYSYGGGNSYCYYGQSQWYMLVFTLENANAVLEAQDGVTNCSNYFYNYQGEDGHTLTQGMSCN